jgi:hypothetical protein
MCHDTGAVQGVTDATDLGGMQGPSSVEGFPTRDEGARDLVKARAEVETSQLQGGEAPLCSRLRLGRLSIARNQRLELVGCVGLEERSDQMRQSIRFIAAIIRLV